MYYIICPSCGKKHRYNKPDYNDLIGKKTACKKCKMSWTISINDLEKGPTPIVEEPVVEEPVVEEPPKKMKSFHLSLSNPNDPPMPLKLPSISPSFWVSIKRHFTFKDMLYLSWMKFFYFLLFLLTVLNSILVTVEYFWSKDNEAKSLAVLAVPWIALFWSRMIIEFGVLFFRIHEELVELNDKTKDSNGSRR